MIINHQRGECFATLLLDGTPCNNILSDSLAGPVALSACLSQPAIYNAFLACGSTTPRYPAQLLTWSACIQGVILERHHAPHV
jgi:hypothetical protein